VFGLFLTPVFYVVIRNFLIWLAKKRGKDPHNTTPDKHDPHATPSHA
jgi:HAE1 family hydrophobic/amphiphilic exporter-1